MQQLFINTINMKRILFLSFGIFTAIMSMAQQKTTVTADRVVARQALFLKDAWLDSIQKAGKLKAANTLPTSKAVDDYLKTSPIGNQFASVQEPDFEIDVFPDIQNMIRLYQSESRSMFQWVASHKDSANIKAVLQVGDITDWGQAYEWDTASHQFAILDTAGIPYFTVPGNHDYDGVWNPATRGLTTYNANFGLAKYASRSYWGGYFNTDPLNQGTANSFVKFDVGSKKYLVLGMEFIPRDTVLGWASKVIDSVYAIDPERQVIIITHAYQTTNNERATDTSVYSGISYNLTADNSGEEMWQKLVSKKPSIAYVFNGHFLINNTWAKNGLHGLISSVGDNGNLVHQIFVNYQDDTAWGNGYFMRLKFQPSINKVSVSFFSPWEGHDDIRYAPYTLDDPSLKVISSLGVNGYASIKKGLRVEGQIKSEALHKGRFVFVGNDHALEDTANLRFVKDSGIYIRGVGQTPLPIMTLIAGDSSKGVAPFIVFKDKDSSSVLRMMAYWLNKAQGGSIFIGDSSGAKIAPGSASNNGVGTTALGFRALSRSSTSIHNTAVGSYALQLDTLGNFNSAFGTFALQANINGGDNTAIGEACMYQRTTGSSNVGLGSNTLQANNGNENVAIGKGAMGNANGTGSSNVAVGRSAGRDATGSGNVFIGYFAGASWAGSASNRLYLHNADVSNPLIYGEFDNRLVKINGKLTITDVLNLPASTAPTSSSDASGVDGELRRDSAGNIYLKAGSSWLKFTGATF
jgi:hypothetical protein